MPRYNQGPRAKACTHCRQHKIKCDASRKMPKPCTRCAKLGKECRVDPEFKPRRGNQLENLQKDIEALQSQIRSLKKSQSPESELHEPVPDPSDVKPPPAPIQEPPAPAPVPESQAPSHIVPVPGPWSLESVVLAEERGSQLHTKFVNDYLPFLPIIESSSPAELYAQSDMLFWTVMITASLDDPSPDFYLSLIEPLKRLVAKTCFMESPRSSQVVQALLILANWPLPNQKVLDDTAFRYTNMARCFAMQLGMHRGKFVYEFTRKQKVMRNDVKMRTRTWVAIFVTEQIVSGAMGLPASTRVDYLIDKAAEPSSDLLPQSYQAILKYALVSHKLTTLMGSSTHTSDGLLDPDLRAPTLEIFLHNLALEKSQIADPNAYVSSVYQYLRCTVSAFAFLPNTPAADQTDHISMAFESATHTITLLRSYVGKRRILEFPMLVRHALSFSAIILFRLHTLPQFPSKFFESARQSIVTVHYLYRNIPEAWSAIPTDVSRVAKILESLNNVLITQPYLLTSSHKILSRMRSHLAWSIFYELVWTIHKARRNNAHDGHDVPEELRVEKVPEEQIRRLPPLPLYSSISTEDYTSSMNISPNGTTMTRLTRAKELKSDYADCNLPEAPQYESYETDALLQDTNWMFYEQDDFLGWLPNADYFVNS